MACTIGAKQRAEPSFFGRTRILSKPTAPAPGRGSLAIAGSEDIIDAMDLRAFGIQPRAWLEEFRRTRRDRTLIAVAAFLLSLAQSIYGVGTFWIPEALKSPPALGCQARRHCLHADCDAAASGLRF